MGFFSKAWKGVKKVVKKVARTVKKIAKKTAYAIPGGKQLWKAAGKVGTKIMGAIGKVTNALGPVGMIALSVLAPYAAPLWSAFGAASAAAGGVLGSIGTAVYTAGNWVAGTLGAMSQGISNAISTIAEGGFSGLASGSLSKAATQAVDGFAQAFTGKAGAAGVQAGVQAATDFAIKEAAGQSLLDQTVNRITGDVAGDAATQTLADTNARIEQNLIDLNPATTAQDQFALTQSNVNAATDFSRQGLAEASTSQFAPETLQTQGLNMIKGNTSAPTTALSTSFKDKAGTVAKALLNNKSESTSSAIQPIGDVGGQFFQGNAFASGGTGSSGGSFLSQAMLQAMQQQQQRMARGFS